MKKLPLCLLFSLILGEVSAIFSSFTQSESVCFAKYNVFIDSSIKGTYFAQESLNVQSQYFNSTTASPIDERQFEDLFRHRLLFDGNTGLRATYKELISTNSPLAESWRENYALSEWTIGIWFMVKELPTSGSKSQTILSLGINQGVSPIELSCKLHSDLKIKCFEESQSQKMEVDLRAVKFRTHEWYYLILDSREHYHRLSVLDQAWENVIDHPIASNSPLSIGKLDVNLGLRHQGERDSGFKGYLRGFKAFRKMWGAHKYWKNAAFQYLHPEGSPALLLELSLDDAKNTSGRFEQVNQAVFEFITPEEGLLPNLVEERDYSPNWDCFYQDPRDYLDLFRFQGENTQLENITLSNYKDNSDKSGSYQSTLKMWIYREHLSSTQGEVKVLQNGTLSGRKEQDHHVFLGDEVLFKHDGIMTLVFHKNSSDYLSIYNLDDPSIKIQVRVPRGQWVWLNTEHSESYFSAFIEDMDRRVISKETLLIRHNGAPNFKTNSKYVNIAPNYFGYIRGIQYFKNLQINKDAVYFDEASSSNSSLLFYYKFDQENMRNGRFSNLATFNGATFYPAVFNDTVVEVHPFDPSQQVVRARNKQMLIDRIPFKPRDNRFFTGDINNDVKWDGLMCNEGKQNVILRNQTSKMSLNFNSRGQKISQLYLSVWLKVKSRYRNLPDGPIVRLTPYQNETKVYMDLSFDQNSLRCNVYDTETGSKLQQSMKFYKFQEWSSKDKWMHVSCFIDGNITSALEVGKNHLLGILHSEGESLHYSYKQSDNADSLKKNYYVYKPFLIPDTKLKVMLNGPFFSGWSNGYDQNTDGMLFQDLRIWNRRLSSGEIMVQRHQKLIYPSRDNDLLVYAPLLEGTRYPFKFFNFLTSKTFVTNQTAYEFDKSGDQKWSLLICPYYMIYSLSKQGCVVELFQHPQKIQGLLGKGRFDAGYTLRLDDIRYADDQITYMRNVAPLIVQNTWNLTSQEELSKPVIQGIQSQENAQQLFISDFEIETLKTNQQIYLSLKIDSILKQNLFKPLNHNYSLKLNPCGSFFDLDSNTSYVVQHLTGQRGTVDFKFKFSGTSCEDFAFDPASETLKLELFYGDKERVDVTNFTRDRNEITVNGTVLASIPYSEPFYIICTALFSGKVGSGVAQELSIVYKLDWQPSINLDLLSQNIGVPFGKDLLVEASKVFIKNTDENEKLEELLEWMWLCPSNLDCSEIDTSGKRLWIRSSTLKRMDKMDYMTKYSFVLRVNTRRNLPEEVPFMQRIVNVTWLGEPKNITIRYPSSRYSVSKDIVFQVDVEDQGWFSECNIEWLVHGSDEETWKVARALNASTDFKNSNNQIKFIVNKDTLTAFGQYKVLLRLYTKFFDNQLIYFTSRDIFVVTAPYNGKVEISAESGLAIQTNFTLSAPGWLSYNQVPQDLFYQFFYEDKDGSLIALAPASLETKLETILPPTNRVFVKVQDDIDGVTLRNVSVSVTLGSSLNTAFYQSRLTEIIDSVYNNTKPFEELRQLLIWTGSLTAFSERATSEEVASLSRQSLRGLRLCLGKLKLISNPQQREFLTGSAFQMLKQTQTLTGNRQNLAIIEESLEVLNNLLDFQSEVLGKVLDTSSKETAKYYLNFATSILKDINAFSESFDLDNDQNKTLSVQTMQYRMMLSPLEAVIGANIKDGERVQIGNSEMEVQMRKYSKQSSYESDFSFTSADKGVSLLYPLTQTDSPSISQTLTLVAFSNKVAGSEADYEPAFMTRGGPFSGKRLMSQKILSPSTVYLTYRNQSGAEIQGDQEVFMKFELKNTDYIKNLFDQKRQKAIKCAYIPTDDFNFDIFKTDLCHTKVINAQNEVVLDSRKKEDNDSDALKRLKALQTPSPYEMIRNSDQLDVECRCKHMSYFTIVEDIPINGEERFDQLEYLSDLPSFNDWSTFLVILLVLVMLISGLLFARGMDESDHQKLKQTEEATDAKPSKRAATMARYSLMTWVFNRSMELEPYCQQNLKACCQKKDQVGVSTWVLFKLYLAQLHPVFQLQGHHDISILRLDRVLTLFVKSILCFGLCYFVLSPVENQQFFLGNIAAAFENETWYKASEARAVLVCAACFLILLPLPSCCYNTCRAQHRLQVQIMSSGPESEAFRQYLERAEVVEAHSTSQTRPGSPTATTDLSRTADIRDVQIYIDPLWPISVAMTINAMPFTTLQTINPILQRPYTSKPFKKIISLVEKESNAMQFDVLPYVGAEPDVYSEEGEQEEQIEFYDEEASKSKVGASASHSKVPLRLTHGAQEWAQGDDEPGLDAPPSPQTTLSPVARSGVKVYRHAERQDSDLIEYATKQFAEFQQNRRVTTKREFEVAERRGSAGESVEMEDETFTSISNVSRPGKSRNLQRSPVHKEGGDEDFPKTNMRYSQRSDEEEGNDGQPRQLIVVDENGREMIINEEEIDGPDEESEDQIEDEGELHIPEVPLEGDNANYIQDEHGNVLRLEEVDGDLKEYQNELYEDENEDSEVPQLVFVDERKELVHVRNLYAKILSRCALLVIVASVLYLWFQDYVLKRRAWLRPTYLWQGVFVAIHALAYFLIYPVLLFLHALLMANGGYLRLCCKSEDSLLRAMPLSLMLYIDLKQQSGALQEVKRNRKTQMRKAGIPASQRVMLNK